MKRFIFGSILRKLPLFIILTVVFSSIAIFSASNVDFIIRRDYYVTIYGDPGFTFLVVFFFIIMTILPLFSMNYRYSLAKADMFKQAAFKDKSIRYAEHLSTLIVTLIGFTFAYLVFVGLLAFRNYTTTIPQNGYYNNPDNPPIVWYLQYVYFLPLYFVTVIFGVAQYFISYLFVSRSNCVRNSIIILIMGELVLFALPTLLASFVKESCHPYTFIAYTGASPALPMISTVEVFNFAIGSGGNYFEYYRDLTGEDMNSFTLFMFIFNYLIYIGMTVLGIIAFTKEKDPSGEFAGKSLTKKPFQEIIFHAGFALFGTFISSMMIRSNIISYLLFLVFFLAAYYPLYGTLIRNFKLKPWQILVMAGVVLFMVTVSASNNVVRNYYDGIY